MLARCPARRAGPLPQNVAAGESDLSRSRASVALDARSTLTQLCHPQQPTATTRQQPIQFNSIQSKQARHGQTRTPGPGQTAEGAHVTTFKRRPTAQNYTSALLGSGGCRLAPRRVSRSPCTLPSSPSSLARFRSARARAERKRAREDGEDGRVHGERETRRGASRQPPLPKSADV